MVPQIGTRSSRRLRYLPSEMADRSPTMDRDPEALDGLPDVRDGLTRLERVILWQLDVTQKEKRGRNVPTAMLYGRVVEHVNVSVDEFQRVLSRLVGAGSK
jgi:hypothetical protein